MTTDISSNAEVGKLPKGPATQTYFAVMDSNSGNEKPGTPKLGQSKDEDYFSNSDDDDFFQSEGHRSADVLN